jgi:hypothetical protein
MVPGLSEAMAEIVAGAVNTGPALTSLLWLAANRDRLRAPSGASWGLRRNARRTRCWSGNIPTEGRETCVSTRISPTPSATRR